MPHLPKLIEDLALILISGALISIIFRLIKQPVVLGYILAGFIIGPHFDFAPSVADHNNVKTLAEIGVIFLLFSLGLEFSFKKLVRVGGTASITALVEIIFITFAGYFTGRWLGWSNMDSIFLGGMLASSSTTIILRAFDELNVKTRQFAGIVFGVLIVEDIVVILLMVILSTISISQNFEGVSLLITITRLLFFLLLWFLAGIFLIPTLLSRAKRLLNAETMLILSLGLCLGMVVVATSVGFSAELGAFIMGSIFAETTSAEKVERVTKPVKDLFGLVFFVSVGMLIDPAAVVEHKWAVLAVTAVTLVGKFVSTTGGALLSGQPLKQSIQVGMSMAQIGEFAFIVATLGLSLGVISDALFPVAVGASAITTFTTPYMIKGSDAFYNFLQRILPKRWLESLGRYSTSTQRIQAESSWKTVLKAYLINAVANGIILISILLLFTQIVLPYVHRNIEESMAIRIVTFLVGLAAATPFLWGFMTRKVGKLKYRELWLKNRYSKGPLLVIEILRNVLGVIYVGVFVEKFFSAQIAILVVVPVVIGVFYLFSRKLQKFYSKIEGRFIDNLHSRENATIEHDPVEAGLLLKNASLQSELTPWSAYIIELQVPQLAVYAGQRLEDLKWRENYSINIAYIKRADKLILTPGGKVQIFPLDKVGIISTEEQLQRFKAVFDTEEVLSGEAEKLDEVVLQKVIVDERNKLNGITIRESQIRERTNGLIIGIERNGDRILNPESTNVFKWNDTIWLVGERDKIDKFLKPKNKA